MKIFATLTALTAILVSNAVFAESMLEERMTQLEHRLEQIEKHPSTWSCSLICHTDEAYVNRSLATGSGSTAKEAFDAASRACYRPMERHPQEYYPMPDQSIQKSCVKD